jgi:lactoylglutathione lyase
MKISLEHVALWTTRLEVLKEYYVNYFGGIAGPKYRNETKDFESYFIAFSSGARLEIMSMPGIPENINDRIGTQHLGLIHMAFGVDTMEDVDAKANELKMNGHLIISGPRKTGDGYYEFETLDPDLNRLEVTTRWVDH